MRSASLAALVQTWRTEAKTFRAYGEERLAIACERHADQVEAAAVAEEAREVTLEEAAQIGGYSYSHLQHLVARGDIENVGTKHSPRIRGADVPRKPGHRAEDGAPTAKSDILDRTLRLHRAKES